MVLLLSVGCLVVGYSSWYMSTVGNGSKLGRQLLVFISSMSVVLSSVDVISLFGGWELIGLCSILLIGYHGSVRSESVRASLKAGVYNRIGDVGLLVGLLLGGSSSGSLLVWS